MSKPKRSGLKRNRFVHQKFHGKLNVSSSSNLIPYYSAVKVVTINGKKYVKKTHSGFFLQPDVNQSKHALNPELARSLTAGESIVLRGVSRIYNRLKRKGVFRKKEKKIYLLNFSKLFRVNLSKTKPSKNFILSEYINAPDAGRLYSFVKFGKILGASPKEEKKCMQFIKKQRLIKVLENKKSRESFASKLYSAVEQAARDLAVAEKEFKKNAAKKGLNENVLFDVSERKDNVLFRVPETDFNEIKRDNFVVNSFERGVFNLTLIDLLYPSSDKKFHPSITRTKKRNKLKQWENKNPKEFYSSEGHPKRRKKK